MSPRADRETIAGRGISRRRLLASLGLASAWGFLTLGLGEILSRVLAPARPMLRFQKVIERMENRGLDDPLIDVIESDPELFWRLARNRTLPEETYPFRGLISNRQGFREDHEISPRKKPGEIRLLFVGDSCTFGFGLKHTETFVHFVETTLRTMFPCVVVECINAGVPGYSAFQGWRFLETWGFGYEPDLVVFSFGINDGSSWDGLSDLEHYANLKASRPVAGLRWSRLAQLAWEATHRTGAADGAPSKRPRLLPEEFSSVLENVHRATQREGVDLLLMVWPARKNIRPDIPRSARTELQREIYAYGQSKLEFGPDRVRGDVDLIPVVQSMARHRSPAEIFQDHVHTTEAANRQIANAIVSKLRPWLEARL